MARARTTWWRWRAGRGRAAGRRRARSASIATATGARRARRAADARLCAGRGAAATMVVVETVGRAAPTRRVRLARVCSTPSTQGRATHRSPLAQRMPRPPYPTPARPRAMSVWARACLRVGRSKDAVMRSSGRGEALARRWGSGWCCSRSWSPPALSHSGAAPLPAPARSRLWSAARGVASLPGTQAQQVAASPLAPLPAGSARGWALGSVRVVQ